MATTTTNTNGDQTMTNATTTVQTTATDAITFVPTFVDAADRGSFTTDGDYNDTIENTRSNVELLIDGTHHRLGVVIVADGESGRQECGGPFVNGPWCQTFGLAMCIHNGSAAMKAAERADRNARTIVVKTGSLLLIDGNVYRVRVDRNEWIELDRVAINDMLIAGLTAAIGTAVSKTIATAAADGTPQTGDIRESNHDGI